MLHRGLAVDHDQDTECPKLITLDFKKQPRFSLAHDKDMDRNMDMDGNMDRDRDIGLWIGIWMGIRIGI